MPGNRVVMGDLNDLKKSLAFFSENPIIVGSGGIVLSSRLPCRCCVRGAFRARRNVTT